ncbi:zinc finger BED domain-containing protein RICESLEEPER 2-like [Helianthus annuus]|uniref:zinc finger BED domain-containing protein RICESLEEPER 2-like n=2 Tax=Helianthus annuus TaxID=4232 RepID=UPI001652D91D|nr:zinc finger BED domain-containing protein RICESLEEPER 2-like [Helianthus annuus]
MSSTNPTQRKRKYKGRAPPGPDQAVISWKEEEFNNLVGGMGFRPEWGAQYPPVGSTALDAPPGHITLYAAFFREVSFRLPITKFTAAVLRGYGLHISQLNAIGLPRITHFEYVCRAYRIEPTFQMFNVFYSVTYASSFYSFQARSGVAPVCSMPLKSLHDWKQKFFYIRRGVIPIDMPYRQVGQGIPKVDVMEDYGAQDWFKRITQKATAISQLDEMALVGAGMSLLWVPKNPLGQSVYSYQGKSLEFKKVFVNYADRESSYNTLPSEDDWKKVEDVCTFLALFNEATRIISGSEYPTSNLFLSELYGIKEALDEVALDVDDCMKDMVDEMKKKFDKYWGSCNLLISIGAVLDPRYKMHLIKFSFKSIYSKEKVDQEIQLVEKCLEELFKEYVEAYKEPNAGSSRSVNDGSGPSGSRSGSSNFTSSRFGKSIKTGSAKYHQHIKSVDCVQSAKSELATYLEEGVCIIEQGVHFDALRWWKDNKLKYKVLSKMAADILAIPITTVASESAFSAGGRVIDPHRSALGTKMVDMLICGADWYRQYYGLEKKKKENDDVVYIALL